MKRKRWVATFLALTTVSLCLGLAGSEEARAAYPEKVIKLIIPFGAGGGFDGLARALAPRLEKELGVTIVIKNVRGAGGRRGSISLYKSKPDGYTIGIAHFAALQLDEVLRGKKSPIDYKKFEVIMRVTQTRFYVYVNKKLPFKSLSDLSKAGRPIKFGSTGVGNPPWVTAQALGTDVGFSTTFVTGYKNLTELALAVARGDVDAGTGGYAHIRGVLDDLQPLVYLSDKRGTHLPSVPTIIEAGYERLSALGVPRVFTAPPGTPKARMEVLRSALRKVISREEFKSWAKDAGYLLAPLEAGEFWKALGVSAEIYSGLKSKMQIK